MMRAFLTLKRIFRRRVQLIMLSTLALLCLVAAAYMSAQIFLKLDKYGTSNADNLQWITAQLEVDQVKLILAMEQAKSDLPESIAEAEQRFDILFSRATVLKNGIAKSDTIKGTPC